MITRKNNLMHTYEIVDVCLGIVVSEFISTEFAYAYKFGYWNYLQTRKNYICRGLGLNPYKFEVR